MQNSTVSRSIRRVSARIRNSLLLAILPAILAVSAGAQFLGDVGLQTVTQKFSISVTTASSTFSLPNLGQIGHTVQYQWSGTPSSGCEFFLDGSTDGVNWIVMAAGPAPQSGSFPGSFIYANGYFNALRFKVNPGALAGCNGTTLTGVYVGYESPLPPQQITNTATGSTGVGMVAATTPNNLLAAVAGEPLMLTSLQCYNPNATVAYLQVFFTVSNPGLGAPVPVGFGIPATSQFAYVGPPMFGVGGIWIGAATTPTGSTAVGTAVDCWGSYSLTGPFYPIAPNDNP